MVPVLARGAASIAPSLAQYVSSNKPGVLQKAKEWLGRVTGKPVASLSRWASSNDTNGGMFLESLVRSGFGVDEIRLAVPVNDSSEVAAFLEKLRALESDVEDQVSSIQAGVLESMPSTDDLGRVRLAQSYVKLLGRVLGLSTISQLQDVITAMNSLNENDLTVVSMLYGENI